MLLGLGLAAAATVSLSRGLGQMFVCSIESSVVLVQYSLLGWILAGSVCVCFCHCCCCMPACSTYFNGAAQAYSHLSRVEIPQMAPKAKLLPFRAANNGGVGLEDATVASLAALEKAASVGINVCVGKEWYRYPSSFFLAELPRALGKSGDGDAAKAVVRLQFVKSSFGGQLPQHFPEGPEDPSKYSSVVQPGFNDLNKVLERHGLFSRCSVAPVLSLTQ